MMSQMKFKLELKLLFLPILILVISVLLNLDKFEVSFIKAMIHVLFQTSLTYGLIAIFQRWLLIRIMIAFVIAVGFFIQLTYDAPLSVSVIMSVLNSSPSESLSFVQFNLFTFLMAFVFLLGMIFLYLPQKSSVNAVFLAVGLSYLVIPSLTSSQELYSSPNYTHYLKTGMARGHSELFTSVEYIVQEDIARRFPLLRSLRGITDTITLMSLQHELSSTWTEVSSEGSPELLVIGIGESLRKDNLGIYGYTRNTTPRLLKLSDNLNVYRHAYAAGTNTWGSIPATLTLAGAGARPDFSKSIINLAKDAGYETFWFSNQARYSHWDFSVSSIAEQADHVYFSSDEEAGLEYDSILVSKLLETLKDSKETKKRLIILNYYGSHMKFSDRYPSEYSYFNGDNSLLDQYDNSVLYTDFIQSEVIKVVSKYNGKYLFFADHGLGDPEGDIPLKHDVRSNPNIDSIKVPLLTYPKTKMNIKTDEVVSLFYFECIFSEWAGISAAELRNGYCNNALNKKEISFLDSNLLRHEVSLPNE